MSYQLIGIKDKIVKISDCSIVIVKIVVTDIGQYHSRSLLYS